MKRSPRIVRRAAASLVAAVCGFTAAISVPGARQEAFECMEEVVLSWDGGDEISLTEPVDFEEEAGYQAAEEARERASVFLALAMGAGGTFGPTVLPPQHGVGVLVPLDRDVPNPISNPGFPVQPHAPPVA